MTGIEVVELILVRHGRAGRKEQWSRSDQLRPLDAAGVRQAAWLVDFVVPLAPGRIVSSPYRRCLQTIAPLAEAVGVGVETSNALVPDAPLLDALELVRDLSRTRTRLRSVVCTHGEVLGALLRELAGADRVDLERRPPGLKGCVWVLEFESGRLLRARYTAPRG